MDKFESVIIIEDNVKDDEIKNVIENITKLITDNKGEVVSVEEMGIKKLAYGIFSLVETVRLKIFLKNFSP